jgi:hypothetical protein
VITLIQASRVFFDNSSVSAGILKIPTPTCFRLVSQPNMEQFAAGIAKKSPKTMILCSLLLIYKILLHKYLVQCTLASTWSLYRDALRLFQLIGRQFHWVTTYGRHACSIKNNFVLQVKHNWKIKISVSKAKISRQINDIRDTGPDTENTDHGPDLGFYGPLVNQTE